MALIPALLIGVAIIGFMNLKREYQRYLDVVVVASKLQELLGLNDPLHSSRFPKDTTLLPARYLSGSFESSDAFVASELKKKGSLHWYLKLLHGTYVLIGLLLVLGVRVVVNPSH